MQIIESEATDATCKQLENKTISKWKSPLSSKKKCAQLENEATCKPKQSIRVTPLKILAIN